MKSADAALLLTRQIAIKYSMLELVKVVVIMLVAAHWYSCVWTLQAALLNETILESWLGNYGYCEERLRLPSTDGFGGGGFVPCPEAPDSCAFPSVGYPELWKPLGAPLGPRVALAPYRWQRRFEHATVTLDLDDPIGGSAVRFHAPALGAAIASVVERKWSGQDDDRRRQSSHY